jgi:hypothetical protein
MKLFATILLLVWTVMILAARADDLDAAYAACRPYRHISNPRIGVTWDAGFEHCALDETAYAHRKAAEDEGNNIRGGHVKAWWRKSQ